MTFTEQALVFPVRGEPLLAIVARPAAPRDCGVLIVVGGPQYRVGSHRQFLLLSRRLAAEGYPALRFDYRGMGDSGGEMRSFDAVSDDLAAAADALQQACPSVKRIVLWGLCDAASAALLYVQCSGDQRIAGLVVLNPWVRSEASLAQTQIKHYYGQRILQKAFWIKLLSGRMNLFKSLAGLLDTAIEARGKGLADEEQGASFQDRMAQGLRQFPGAVLLILSGQDLVAREFIDQAGSNANWSGLIDRPSVRRVDCPDADHTFSASAQRLAVEDETLEWLERL
jgi:exosortase A-associated hydrolase 1